MVDLFRDVPIRWLVEIPPVLRALDKIELLQETIQTAKVRAIAPARTREVLFQYAETSSRLGQAIARTYVAQQQVTAQYRADLAQIDLGFLRDYTWQQTREVISNTASLGDLIEAGHGNHQVSQRAIKELDDMAQVATCLYADFASIQPLLRLRWAEQFSQYDDPANLRSLANLPGWEQIPFLERREMQALVDWLHNQIDASVPQAVAMINDLIRVCILLASHAPINEIISGTVARPTQALPGGRIVLNANPGKVKIGMHVLMFDKADSDRIVARAVVDDLSSGGISAKVVYAAAQSVQLEKDSRAHFTVAPEITQAVTQMAWKGR
jgi:hypothetical protein